MAAWQKSVLDSELMKYRLRRPCLKTLVIHTGTRISRNVEMLSLTRHGYRRVDNNSPAKLDSASRRK
jgi:hypothetical protein